MGAGRAGGLGGLGRRIIKARPGGVLSEHGPKSVKKTLHVEKQIEEILNGLQKSRNKFFPTSKIKPDKMNIYLGPKCNFEKRAFFLNSNKIAINSKIKSYLILLTNPQYFFILGKSFYSLSHIFIIEIIEDKIIKFK